ncbi:hypothetical protein GCM10027615_56420 [Plantactinospora veratri]
MPEQPVPQPGGGAGGAGTGGQVAECVGGDDQQHQTAGGEWPPPVRPAERRVHGQPESGR